VEPLGEKNWENKDGTLKGKKKLGEEITYLVIYTRIKPSTKIFHGEGCPRTCFQSTFTQWTGRGCRARFTVGHRLWSLPREEGKKLTHAKKPTFHALMEVGRSWECMYELRVYQCMR